MARGVSGDAGGCRCLQTGCVTVTATPYAFLHALGQKRSLAKGSYRLGAARREYTDLGLVES